MATGSSLQRKTNMQSVIQDWVMCLGLRHQGVLMATIRGCDSVPKEDPSKLLTRCLRSVVLVSFDKRPSSFIEFVNDPELYNRMVSVLENLDHYPIHYIMHLMHASEIIGYKHPDIHISSRWAWFYHKMCKGFHVNSETEEQMDNRLGACEKVFAEYATIGMIH
jgi:hypothetical protein